jgi:uncharacterized protein
LRLVLVTLVLLGPLGSLAAQSTDSSARRILEITNYRDVLRISDSAYVEATIRASPQLGPYRDVVQEWADHVFDWERIAPALAERLTAEFSAQELQQLLAFYETPLGKKVIASRPALQRYMTSLAYGATEQYRPELLRKLRTRARELNRTTPKLD